MSRIDHKLLVTNWRTIRVRRSYISEDTCHESVADSPR